LGNPVLPCDDGADAYSSAFSTAGLPGRVTPATLPILGLEDAASFMVLVNLVGVEEKKRFEAANIGGGQG
jgi:hypothetical protein